MEEPTIDQTPEETAAERAYWEQEAMRASYADHIATVVEAESSEWADDGDMWEEAA